MPPTAKAPPHSLPDALRAFLRADGRTAYALAELSGVAEEVIRRFVKGTRGITLDTAGRIADALDLELARRKGGRRK